jgi:GNAT superfamily N-acetyltransferase
LSPVVEVVRTYLELRSPGQFRPARTIDPGVRFLRHDPVRVEDFRRLYRAVGDQWYWHDRNAWSDERVASYFALPNVHLWECVAGGESAGYFELERGADGSVEVAYFGLAAPFIGRGLGKAMLTRAVEEAWALGAARVWLHTCTLDSPHALPNYKARRFEETRKETYVQQLPEAV